MQWDFGFCSGRIAQAVLAICSSPSVDIVGVFDTLWVSGGFHRRGQTDAPKPRKEDIVTCLLTLAVRVIAISVFTLGLYFVLQFSNLTRLALTILGGTGIVGLALGFAFRDIAENFLASLVLSLRNPFRTGDYISVDGTEGIIQNLNARTTVLLMLDGNYIQIPNATVFKNKITNYSSNPYRRSEFMVGIGYECSIGEAQDLMLKVLMTYSAVLPSPEPLVLVDQLEPLQ